MLKIEIKAKQLYLNGEGGEGGNQDSLGLTKG